MSEIGDNLLRDRENTESKSYLVGLERGRVWAVDHADYFAAREWSELDVEELPHLNLPETEDRHFRIISMESGLEFRAYLRGWVAGVREIVGKY